MKTMPLPEIIDALCSLTACSRTQAEQFVTAFEDALSEGLLDSGDVAVNGIGVFRLIASDNEPKIEFAPDPALADAVNAPFAVFEPIELDEEVTGDMLREAAEAAEDSILLSSEESDDIVAGSYAEEAPEGNNGENEAFANEAEAEQDTKVEIQPEIIYDPASTPPPIPDLSQSSSQTCASELPPPIPSCIRTDMSSTVTPTPKPVESEDHNDELSSDKDFIEDNDVYSSPYRHHSRRWAHHHSPNLLIIALLCLVIGAVIGYFGYYLLNLSNVRSVNISAEDVQIYHNGTSPVIVEPMDTDSVAKDSISPDVTPESKADNTVANTAAPKATAVVTDTVRPGRFLTTMALEHYGKKIFWVYIYKENEDKIGNPDQIAPNTIVVIPPAEKYHINPADKTSNDDAARLSAEILSRYN